MRYVAASVVAFILIVAMMVFRSYAEGLVNEWADADVDLNAGQLLLMDAAHWITSYWYAFAIVIIAVCVTIAAVLPRRKRTDLDHSGRLDEN